MPWLKKLVEPGEDEPAISGVRDILKPVPRPARIQALAKPMSAIDDLFQRLRAAGRKAFVAFIPAGDPDLAFTAELLHRLSRAGISLCELGIPYSDPIADGPVIQAAYTRALARGVRVADVLELAGRLSPQLPYPLVFMTSYAVIFRRGSEAFVAECSRAGVAGLIVPDLPVEESGALLEICRRFDLSLIQLVTPTTPPERALRIAAACTGFLYHVTVTGITGEREQLPAEIRQKVAWLRQHTDLPVCLGFGINRPDQVTALAEVADGVIVGSAIARRIAEAHHRPREEVLEEIVEFVRSLVAALPPSTATSRT